MSHRSRLSEDGTHPVMENATSSRTGGNFYFAYGSNLSHSQMAHRCHGAKSSSEPVAIGRLDGWRWFVCARGYSNIAEGDDITPESPPHGDAGAQKALKIDPDEPDTFAAAADKNSVWGVIYDIAPEDEARLDMYEGHSPYQNDEPRQNTDPSPEARARKPFLQDDWTYNKLYLPVTVTRWHNNPETFNWEPYRPASEVAQSHACSTEPSSEGTKIRVLVYVDEAHTKPGRIEDEYIGRMNRAIQEAIELGVPEHWVENAMRAYVPRDVFPDEGYVGRHVSPVRGRGGKRKNDTVRAADQQWQSQRPQAQEGQA